MALRFASDVAAPRIFLWKAVVLTMFGLTGLVPLAMPDKAPEPGASVSPEWPTELDGQPLRPLAMSDVEQRFAERFPGQIGRFASYGDSVILRIASRPTRMLHPAADCYRGLGYRIKDIRLERDDKARLSRCFVAWRNGVALRVCERLEGADGQAFTDTSAWYWAAMLGRTSGPWLAVTTARHLQP